MTFQHRVRLFTSVAAVLFLLAVPAPAMVGVAGAAIGASAVADDAAAPTDDAATPAGDDQAAASIGAPTFPMETGPESAMVDLTNADRAGNGLAALSFDPSLLDIARQRAAAQLNSSPLSHYDASGQLAFVGLLANASVDYTLAGENLARTTGSDPATLARVEQALMNSPTHRKNILEPSFNEVAIGVESDSSGRVAFAEIYRATP